MKEPQYPVKFFVFGFFLDFFGRHFYLFLPAVVFAIVGIFAPWAVIASAVLLILDLLLSMFSQMQIMHTLTHDDDPNFAPWRSAMRSENWEENVRSLTEEQIRNSKSDDEDEDDDDDEDDDEKGDDPNEDEN
ncbi:MAG: hypothetical protein J6B77_10320 [Clostridia bacterium]|nr:hypothetical protein [Clostridia bacterium]